MQRVPVLAVDGWASPEEPSRYSSGKAASSTVGFEEGNDPHVVGGE